MKNRGQLTNSEIATFCSQTAMILKAGITPVEGMRILLSDTKDNSGKEIIETILASCRVGNSFTNSVKDCGVFPDYVVNMIALGEESGNLDDVMEALGAYYEKEENISESIKGAIRYPLIMIGMMIVVIFVLLTKVLPIFNQVFIQLGSQMSGFSASMLNLGQKLNRYSVALVILVVLVVAIYLVCFKTVKGRAFARKVLNVLPLTKGFYDSVAAGRFAGGLSMALASGMDTFSSLKMISEIVENKAMEEKIEVCRQALNEGDNMAEALEKAGIFSNLYSRMIGVGFKTGNIDVVMSKISADYDKATDKKLSGIIAVLEPTLVIILSLIVGMILLSVILPLIGIMSSIG